MKAYLILSVEGLFKLNQNNKIFVLQILVHDKNLYMTKNCENRLTLKSQWLNTVEFYFSFKLHV